MIPRPSPGAAPTLAVDTVIEDDAWGGHAPLEALVVRAVNAAARHLPVPPGAGVAVLLADDAAVQVLNRDYRGKDKATNVLSFPSDDQAHAMGHLGDIILARETVMREAESEGKTLEAHLTHLTIHGVLHLFGHDHENDDDAAEMEALETRILGELGIADPYHEGD